VIRLAFLGLLAAAAAAQEDPYEAYLKTAPEFERVPAVETPWPTWVYMPWYWKWTIGHDEAAGRFCREHGINGGFTNYGRGPVKWLERNDLFFYNDHTAGKGILYVRGANRKSNFRRYQRDPRAVRTPPLDGAALDEARERIRDSLREIRHSPMRLAYALDDEISWGAFVVPIPWRVHEDDAAYARWLARIHGQEVEPRWVTPDFALAQLGRAVKDIDFQPLLDRMTFNDSVFAEFVGALVDHCNALDAKTPCGFVGGQNPSLWGGYDYAKLCRKTQFLEVYDMGSAPEIVRSLAPRTPLVSTHFHDERPGLDAWKAWHRFAHGQRGMIGWVDEAWFDGKTPRPWLKEFAPTLKEVGRVQGPKLAGARWRHDGIAIYYSHPSVQVSWLLDSEAHGKTWPNRGRDHLLGTSHNVRRAWETILNDSFFQYDFVAYDDVARDGVPDEYRVLVLPACFALSDVEARRIREFAARGGHVVADFMCGLFDQHGRGRAHGALDDLFGIERDGTERAEDFFGDRLWVETDQDEGFGAERWTGLPEPEGTRTEHGFVVAERKRGTLRVRRNACYLNLSPLRYLRLREAGLAEPRHRDVFLKSFPTKPLVTVEGDRLVEVTMWTKDDRTLLFVVQNPVLHLDGKRSVQRGKVPIELRFAREVEDLRNERTGEALGKGDRFEVDFVRTEAVFCSFHTPE